MNYLNTIYKKSILSFSIVLLPFLLLISNAHAEEKLTIENNGSAAQNTISLASTNKTSVTQSNTASIQNTASSITTTGGNKANDNTGGSTTVQTGNSTASTTVSNQNINTNAADVNKCNCSAGKTLTVSGNGTESVNAADVLRSNSVSVSQINIANITNNSRASANTGDNRANGNNGDTTIRTGSIESNTILQNKNVNNSRLSVTGAGRDADMVVKIIGNGAFSENSVKTVDNHEVNISSLNLSNIVNQAISDLFTGGNKASTNLGSVLIQTGNIVSSVTVHNENINSNIAKVECNCNKNQGGQPPSGGGGNQNPQPTTPPPSSPNTTSSNNATSGGVGGGPGSVLGATSGSVLPSTGSYFLFLMTLASLLMLAMGLYLRMHSANSPGRLSYVTA